MLNKKLKLNVMLIRTRKLAQLPIIRKKRSIQSGITMVWNLT